MRAWLGIVAAVACGAWAPAALGDDSAEREAHKRFAEGLRSYDEAEAKHDPKLYEAAYLAFVQAYRLYPSDKVLLNLALSEVKSARYVDGLVHLRLYEARAHVQPGHPKYPIV